MAKNKKEEYKEQNLLFMEETASQEGSCRVAYYIRYWSGGRVLFRPN